MEMDAPTLEMESATLELDAPTLEMEAATLELDAPRMEMEAATLEMDGPTLELERRGVKLEAQKELNHEGWQLQRACIALHRRCRARSLHGRFESALAERLPMREDRGEVMRKPVLERQRRPLHALIVQRMAQHEEFASLWPSTGVVAVVLFPMRGSEIERVAGIAVVEFSGTLG